MKDNGILQRPSPLRAPLRTDAPGRGKAPKARLSPELRDRMNALLEAVAIDRDKSAFAELFEYYAPRVKSYLIRLGSDAGVADELAQEALLSVWRKAHLFDKRKASAGTWIFTIARNLRIDALRRENRPELDPEDPALVPEAERPADDAVASAQTGEQIRLALKTLPSEQVEVVRLSFYEEMSHSAIAEQLDIPLGTVKSRLRLACGRIRKLLEDEEQ